MFTPSASCTASSRIWPGGAEVSRNGDGTVLWPALGAARYACAMKNLAALAIVLGLASCKAAPTVGPLGVAVGTRIQSVVLGDGSRLALPPDWPWSGPIVGPMTVDDIDGSMVTLRGKYQGNRGPEEWEMQIDFDKVSAWDPAK